MRGDTLRTPGNDYTPSSGTGPTQSVPVELEDGTTFLVELPGEVTRGREQVSGNDEKLQNKLGESIRGIVSTITEPLRQVKPNKATLKLGLEIGIEQGSLVAMIVRGTGKTNVEITLEWDAKTLNELAEAKEKAKAADPAARLVTGS